MFGDKEITLITIKIVLKRIYRVKEVVFEGIYEILPKGLYINYQ
jgi:hypothetical protein